MLWNVCSVQEKEVEVLGKYNAFKDKRPDYGFKIDGDIAQGTLPDGTTFLIDKDKMELVSKYWFHLNWKGYIYTLKSQDKESNIRLHWLVLGYTEKPDFIIDHINRDKTDCRLSNLRIVTNQQNAMNRTLGKNNKSGYLGAFYSKARKCYIAKISINKKQIIVHTSQNIIECAQAYNYASQLLFGEFAGYQNEVPETSLEIKQMVEFKCQPYMDEALVATQRCGHFLCEEKGV